MDALLSPKPGSMRYIRGEGEKREERVKIQECEEWQIEKAERP